MENENEHKIKIGKIDRGIDWKIEHFQEGWIMLESNPSRMR
jgi:hypothetical protein